MSHLLRCCLFPWFPCWQYKSNPGPVSSYTLSQKPTLLAMIKKYGSVQQRTHQGRTVISKAVLGGEVKAMKGFTAAQEQPYYPLLRGPLMHCVGVDSFLKGCCLGSALCLIYRHFFRGGRKHTELIPFGNFPALHRSYAPLRHASVTLLWLLPGRAEEWAWGGGAALAQTEQTKR